MIRSVNLYSKNAYVATVKIDTGKEEFVEAIQLQGKTYKVETLDRYCEISVLVIADADAETSTLLRAQPIDVKPAESASDNSVGGDHVS